MVRRSIQRQADAQQVDAILTIPDIGAFDRPFYIYQDLSYDLVLREIAAGNLAARSDFDVLSVDQIERLAERQREIFEQASGILAMSEWYRRSLVQDTGLCPAKVHVIQPGATATTDSDPIDPENRVPNLLFVGRDFTRKGGDLLLDAVRRLRADGMECGLTIVGPPAPPVHSPVEDWVDFRGERPPDEVAEAMRTHMAFVLPTRFDGYGIAYHEALRAGTPAVGPNAFAVPEIITDGVDGALFSGWTPAEIADAVVRACEPTVRENAFISGGNQGEHLSWKRAAEEIRSVIAL